ncbi:MULTISPECIES: hypothetical protein [unclassified Tolypothrix]|uniref:hypothetical protein n=1 Tax=unclassified Tolypothrix TaxID=2649714 RepID=UPI0005EAC2D4|nr:MULTISPECIES: hypothetical protein [unclassified Tolypothrix]EKF02583.1 hypothetical protein FDUTEX481_06747 [Tolypothrix sp. PCC 7601]MBE9088150.1 hypothetical protein [Tolypothrix sp. LEGE 11397]UYD23874.1 hypothetical protein HGR01_20445 [Tolypothrix sp. PCC 7712]UYD33901.1 hypothetical protein HG267_34310 [Tolypothrix sp. PCC 7601]
MRGITPNPHYQLPITNYTLPNAQCPMPNAQCPMPNAPCPLPTKSDRTSMMSQSAIATLAKT